MLTASLVLIMIVVFKVVGLRSKYVDNDIEQTKSEKTINGGKNSMNKQTITNMGVFKAQPNGTIYFNDSNLSSIGAFLSPHGLGGRESLKS